MEEVLETLPEGELLADRLDDGEVLEDLEGDGDED